MDEKTLDFLNKIAEKVGTTVDHLWPVLIRQSVISGVIDLLIVVVLIFLIYLSYTKIRSATFDDEVLQAFSWIGWALFSGITILILAISVGGTIGQIINPEYWALKQILP